MKKEEVRKQKVCEVYRPYLKANESYYEKIPRLNLSGSWLRKAGFEPGDEIQVLCVGDGKIIIEKVAENSTE